MSLTGPRVTETASAQLNTIQISNIEYLQQTHVISDLCLLDLCLLEDKNSRLLVYFVHSEGIKVGLYNQCDVCVSSPLWILNGWTNLYETWYVYHDCWAYPSLQSVSNAYPLIVAMQRLGKKTCHDNKYIHNNFFVISFYLQSVLVHSANCVKRCIQWHVKECSVALLCN
jgi:hypothetical protein